jgi:pimeloyl-ACP methyl ester carboxylesterase
MTFRHQDLLMELDGARLHAQRLLGGFGRTIVFLHDSLGSVSTWREFPHRLCLGAGMDGLLYDREGYGRSSPLAGSRKIDYHRREAGVLAKLLKKLDLEQVVLFGHSDGATIALLAAALHPGLIRGVISEAGHVFNETITQDGVRAAKARYDADEKLFTRLAKHHGGNAAKVLQIWAGDWLSEDFRSWNIEEFLPQIKCPVLVMQGENDDFGTRAQVEAICNGVGAKAEACLLPGAGHTPHREAEDVVLEKSATFISKL